MSRVTRKLAQLGSDRVVTERSTVDAPGGENRQMRRKRERMERSVQRELAKGSVAALAARVWADVTGGKGVVLDAAGKPVEPCSGVEGGQP